jgi:site-specific DNA-cytosine methylase
MNVISLFDGISVARVALDYADIKVKKYYSAEIDKYAIQVSTKNYPDIIRLGSVVDITAEKLVLPEGEHFDLLIGGSPCQDLSIAKKDRKGLDGDRSGLFWEYIRIRDLIKPKYFILENVASMHKKDKDIITEAMGVEPILFNASLVSAQTRKRLFWTNIKFEMPDDRGIILKDILQEGAEVDERMVNADKKAYTLTATYQGAFEKNSVKKKQRTMVKSNTNTIRKLTPLECERLQSLPDEYTEGVSKTQRYKCIGNAFNAEVIAHILQNIPKNQN